jgi:ribosomal protein S12 methylthiotransferase accessory factor
MVYVPYRFYRGTGDSPVVQPISTGLACHGSLAAAALSGLHEVIERDAFTITWQAMLAMPQIRVETLSDATYDLVQRFERTGSTVALRTRSLEGPALVFAAAAALDPERAVRSALEELAHTRRYSQQIMARMPRLACDPDYGNVVDQLDHLNLYCDHANVGLADFIFASKKRVEFDAIPDLATGDAEKDLATVVNKIQSTGHRVVMVDVTTPDVRDLGLSVVRAIVPGFNPLFMGHPIRATGGARLWEVPRKLSLGGRSRELGDNPAPHPYP